MNKIGLLLIAGLLIGGCGLSPNIDLPSSRSDEDSDGFEQGDGDGLTTGGDSDDQGTGAGTGLPPTVNCNELGGAGGESQQTAGGACATSEDN